MKNARILIVEDQAIIAKDLGMMVTEIGYKVAGYAATAEDAIKKAVELKPDLILMDIVLRGKKNGIDASYEIKEKMDIPVIFLTAYADIELIDKAKTIEPYAYIVKPFQERQLLASIEIALFKSQMEKKLQESEEKYRSLVENSLDGIVIVQGLKIRFVNRALLKIFDLRSEEKVVGRKFTDFISPQYRRLMKVGGFARKKEEYEPSYYQFKALHRDGTEFDAEISISRTVYQGTVARQGIIRDITERKRAKEALVESEGKLNAMLHSIDDHMSMVDKDLNIVWANKTTRKIFGNHIIGKKCYEVYRKRKEPCEPCCTLKAFQDGKVHRHDIQVMDKDGEIIYFYCTANVALRDREGNPTAVLEVSRDTTQLKKAEKELKQSFKKLQKIFKGTTNALTAAVEIRDPYTAGHQQRVTELTVTIAKEMGLSEDQIDGINISALIHDIGKINVPTEILSRPARLTRLEFKMVKTHPRLGYDVLKEIEFPWPVAKIVLQHHERMNGSGYPRGLKNNDILLEARILAVADVVEAMVSHRPYRPAHGIDEALKEISQNKGVLYDSYVVDVCLKLFTEKGFKFEDEANNFI